jgi:hypothetical protein
VSLTGASASHLAECPDLGPECNGPVPPVPYNHHVDLVMSDLSLDASYGLTRWLAAELRFAFRIVDITPSYTEQDGREKLVPDDIHHHDTTIAGPADPWLSLRAGGALGDLRTSGRLGISLPLGATEPDPYELGAQGISHEHTQLGSGTVMPMVGLGLSYAVDPIELSASGLWFFSLYENEHGFRAPSRWFYSIRSTLRLLDGALRPYVELDLPHETQELWGGRPGLEGSNVRTDLLLGAGVTWEFSEPWAVDAGFLARIAQLTDAATFDYPGVLHLGLSTRFDLGKDSAEK